MKKKKPEMMPTLKPEMASMCEVPVLRKRLFIPSSREARSPMVRTFWTSVCHAPDSSILFRKKFLRALMEFTPDLTSSILPLISWLTPSSLFSHLQTLRGDSADAGGELQETASQVDTVAGLKVCARMKGRAQIVQGFGVCERYDF